MIKKILIYVVKFYQENISSKTPARCRFEPTCSNYMITAVKKHGSFLGVIMGIARIIRCNQFNKPGFDEVPDKFTIFRNKNS